MEMSCRRRLAGEYAGDFLQSQLEGSKVVGLPSMAPDNAQASLGFIPVTRSKKFVQETCMQGDLHV